MQLAIGCYNRHTQEKLLKETNISLARFRDIMEADETAQASSTTMRGAPTFAFVALTIRSSGPKRHVRHTNHTTGTTGSRCLGCGHTGHVYKSTDCPAHSKLWRSSGNMHRFQNVCKQKGKKQVSCLSLDSVIRATPQPRLTTAVTIKCAGRATPVSLMVDTGADISTVQESTVALFVVSAHVQPTSTIISNFDGSTITQLCGTLEATVMHDKTRKQAQTTLYVVPDNLPAVAGRDLIQALSLPVTSAVYNPQQNGRAEAWNKFLKNGVQTFQGRDFEQGIQELLMSYRAISPTPASRSPAELMFQHRFRTNAQPALRLQPAPASQPVEPGKTNEGTTNSPKVRLPEFRGPYQCGDVVRTRLPHVPKGTSPFSAPRRVTRVLGDYTYELDDGQVWNARKLVRVRGQPPSSITVERETARRHSARTNFGKPPDRLCYDYW